MHVVEGRAPGSEVVDAAVEEQRSAVKSAGGEEEVVKRTETERAEGKAARRSGGHALPTSTPSANLPVSRT